MTRSKSKTLALVPRVSRVNDRSGERFISPGDQVKEGTRAAKVAGYRVQVIEGDAQGQGVSGATPFDDRPGMSEALRLVESGALAGFVFPYLDRLVREDDVVTLKSFQRRVRKAQAVLIVADTPDACIEDPDDDELEGLAAIPLKVRLMMDSAQREESRKKWKKARRSAALRGILVGPTTLGHTRDEDGRLLRNGTTADAVIRAFEMRVSRKCTDIQIVDMLNETCPPPVKTRTNKKTGVERKTSGKYNRSFVRQMLKNPVYIGHVPNPVDGGYVTSVKRLPDGEIVPVTDERTGVIQLPHEPLISEATFRRAQQGRGRRGPLQKRDKGVLGDVVRCEHDHRCSLDHNARTSFYRCGNVDVHKAAGTVAQPKLENYVLPMVIDNYLDVFTTGGSTPEDETATYEQRIEDARAEIDEVKVSKDMFKSAVAYGFALDDAMSKLADAEKSLATYTPIASAPPKHILISLREKLEAGETIEANEQLRGMVNNAIERITYKPGRVSVEEKVEILWRDGNVTPSPAVDMREIIKGAK